MVLPSKRCLFSTLPQMPFQESVKEKKSWPAHILTMQLIWRIHPLIWHCSCAPPCHPPFWMLSGISSCMLCTSPDLTPKFQLRKRTLLQSFWTKQFPWLFVRDHLATYYFPCPLQARKPQLPSLSILPSESFCTKDSRTFAHKWDTLSPTSTWQTMVLSPWIIITGGKWRTCSQVTWITTLD